MTTLETRTLTLAQLWLQYRTTEQFADFFDYNDIGLPLAYAVANQIVEPLPIAIKMIDETWLLFLEMLGLEDTDGDLQEWTDLRDVFATAETYNGWQLEEE
jgi:hypothetical protein